MRILLDLDTTSTESQIVKWLCEYVDSGYTEINRPVAIGEPRMYVLDSSIDNQFHENPELCVLNAYQMQRLIVWLMSYRKVKVPEGHERSPERDKVLLAAAIESLWATRSMLSTMGITEACFDRVRTAAVEEKKQGSEVADLEGIYNLVTVLRRVLRDMTETT